MRPGRWARVDGGTRPPAPPVPVPRREVPVRGLKRVRACGPQAGLVQGLGIARAHGFPDPSPATQSTDVCEGGASTGTRKLPGSRGWQDRSSPSMTLPTPANTRFFATCTCPAQARGDRMRGTRSGEALPRDRDRSCNHVHPLGQGPQHRYFQRHRRAHLCPQATASKHEDLGAAQPAKEQGGRAGAGTGGLQVCCHSIQACAVIDGISIRHKSYLLCVSTPHMRSWRS